MQKIINFIVQFKEYISLLALIVLSLSLISLGDTSKIGGFRTVVIGTVGWMQELFSFVPNPRALEIENQAIRELNLRLSTEVTRMRQAILENEKLRKMIELKDRSDKQLIAAEVVGKSSVELRNYATLDKGRNTGIDYGMSVRTDAGLVGVIVGMTDNYSLVELISNRNVKISAKFQRTGINGIVVWEGGEYLQVKNIPESFDIKKGDEIVTSNFSNKYPNDIPIGKVSKIEMDPGSLFKKVYVKSNVMFSSLEQVFVVKEQPDPYRSALLKDMEDRLRAKQGKVNR